MVRGRLSMAAMAMAVAFAGGCGVLPSPSASGPPAATEGASSLPAASIPLVPGLDPEALGVTCGDGVVFAGALLAQAGRAELDPDEAAAALRAEIAGGNRIPSQGWIRVGQSATSAHFVAPTAGDGGWWSVGFALGEGGWKVVSEGSCTPELALPPGVSRAEWRLDSDFPEPAPGDRAIHVLINERACASGQSPEGRVLPPSITTTDDAVTIAILVRSQAGGQDCQGNPDFPLEVELPEPLGGRPLFDGAVFPAAGPIGTYSLECGPMPVERCGTWAQEVAANAERLHPGKRVVMISIHGPDGDYDLILDDGTAFGADIN